MKTVAFFAVLSASLAVSTVCMGDFEECTFRAVFDGTAQKYLLAAPEDVSGPVDVLVNCAGVQNSGRDIEVNLKGVMHVTEKYAMGSDRIRAAGANPLDQTPAQTASLAVNNQYFAVISVIVM